MYKLKLIGSLYSVCVCASVCLYSVHLASTTPIQEIILANIALAYSYTLLQTHLGFCTIVLCVRTRHQTWKGSMNICLLKCMHMLNYYG